jgi:hypothetical protein
MKNICLAKNDGQAARLSDSVKMITSFVKGIVQPFELGGVTSLIPSAVRFCKAGHLKKKILMIQSHERSLKPISAA